MSKYIYFNFSLFIIFYCDIKQLVNIIFSVPDRKKKIKGIDYNKEIPFQRKAPAGFYELPDEELRPPEDPSFVNVNLDRLEGKRRTDEEQSKQNMDAKRAKIREQKNMPAAIMQINK